MTLPVGGFWWNVHYFLLGTYPGVELLGHRVCISIAFEDIARKFSQVVVRISTPPSNG